jgi:DNA modification methylase
VSYVHTTYIPEVAGRGEFDPAHAPYGHNVPVRVEMVPTGELVVDPETVRTFSRRDLKAARRIIKRAGVRIPLGIDQENRVLVGEIILHVAKELGIEALPVVRIDDLDRLECQALSVAYARLGELGEFDHGKLKALMIQFEVELPSFELEDLGFEVAQIDLIMADEPEDEPPVPELGTVAVSRAGDLWLLGTHRLLCGDARVAESYAILLEEVRAKAVFTDPPFGCAIDGFVSTKGKHREFVGGTSGMSDAEVASLFDDFNKAMAPHLAPGAAVYEVIDFRSLHALLDAGSRYFGKLVNLAIWAKDRPGQGSFLRSQTELILIWKTKGGKLRNNVELGRHGRSRSNLWSYPSGLTSSKGSDEGNMLENHPTPKPVRLVADALFDTTRRGDVVIDPFLGSGTTLIAAEKTGRVCFGLELDPIYVDLIIRRWQAWSGNQAVHAVSGELFDDRAAATSSVEPGTHSHDGETAD